jgi:DNA-binding transcriptional MocR family regulator
VAVESPTFFGFIDLLQAMHLRVLEIPSHPKKGMSLPALAQALQNEPVRCVLAVPTLSNPMGTIMPLAAKRELFNLLKLHQVPLIEDVVFNDLLASDERRRAVKSLDTGGLVMVCGSFSKTLAPGIRLGWVEAGRWSERVQALKRLQGAATNEVLEHALADLLTQTAYEAQMRRLCAVMKQRLSQARSCVLEHFPKGTLVSDPASGYTLWVQLPDAAMDCLRLYERAALEGISFGPGQLFSTGALFGHCLRLSFSGTWDSECQAALKRLGCLASELWNELQARRLKDSKKDAVDQDSTVQRRAVAALCSSD